MRLLTNARAPGDRIVALGTFDGVHAGHRTLLENGAAYAREHGLLLQAVTFDRHPLEVVFPDHCPKLLTTLPEKIGILNRLGIPEVRMIPFSRAMADMEPEAFLEWLRERIGIRAVIAGWNYSFGKGGRGSADWLREDGKKHGYDVLIEPPVKSEDGEVISSSRIRDLVRAGKVDCAAELMNRPYLISGTVGKGKEIGHRIGFPTANLESDSRKLLPAFGVYVCTAEYRKRKHPAVVNIGRQPTFPSGQVTTEVHCLDGSADLYGERLRIRLHRRLRDEIRFDGADRLIAQIEADTREAAAFFEGRPDLLKEKSN